jgi:hypothetical protein
MPSPDIFLAAMKRFEVCKFLYSIWLFHQVNVFKSDGIALCFVEPNLLHTKPGKYRDKRSWPGRKPFPDVRSARKRFRSAEQQSFCKTTLISSRFNPRPKDPRAGRELQRESMATSSSTPFSEPLEYHLASGQRAATTVVGRACLGVEPPQRMCDRSAVGCRQAVLD